MKPTTGSPHLGMSGKPAHSPQDGRRILVAINGDTDGLIGTPKTPAGAGVKDKASCTIDSVNVQAFLKLVRFSETKKDDASAYYTVYGNHTFTDTSKHPNKSYTRWGRTSNAAGAYQILNSTWVDAVKRGIVSDFSPDSQDKIAFWKLQTRKALSPLCDGNIDKAIEKLRTEWTSLPGAKQSDFTMEEAKERYNAYVKMLAK